MIQENLKAIKGPNASNYKVLDHIDHVLTRTGMYIGLVSRDKKTDWTYSFADKKMHKIKTDISSGAERIFLEGITNSSDNALITREDGEDPGEIVVKMNNLEISIKNGGFPIPIELSSRGTEYVPEFILGTLMTSSNYEDKDSINEKDNKNKKAIERRGAGMNGIGAKAMNIFSKYFKVIIHDHYRKKKYSQVWTDNMRNKEEPVITNYYDKKSSVEIIYQLDFERFGYQPVEKVGNPILGEDCSGGYPAEVFEMFARHCAGISWTSKVPVKFNDVVFDCKNIKEFSKLYFGEAVKNSFIYYKWADGTEVKLNKKFYFDAINKNATPLVELLILDSPDSGEQLSYINSMITRDGGTHMEAIWSKVGKNIIKNINEKLNSRNKEQKNARITINDIKPHLIIIASFIKVPLPDFDSQSKTKLTKPDKSFFNKSLDIMKESYNIIDNWTLYARLLATFEAKTDALLKNTDGKLCKNLGFNAKVLDANFAGDKNLEKRMSTTLYLCEGDSASTYLDSKISYIDRGRDIYGYIPLRGKSLNILNAKIKQISENKEIILIKKYLGLTEDMDYSIDSNYHTLRYGKISILADSDDDGCHIIGLLILYFYCRFPSLLKRGDFLFYEKTPLLRAMKGKTLLKFYTSSNFELWKNENDIRGWKINFYKGLASSEDSDILDDCEDPKIIKLIFDETSKNSLLLAFHKKQSNQRKNWIAERKIDYTDFNIIKEQNITDFVDHHLINFAIANLERCIPKLMDGLKVSQRKILYSVFEYWKVSKDKKNYDKYKVAQLQGKVAEITKYQHGEQNLESNIINMARNYCGTNNISLLKSIGQFGSRLNSDKKTSGRYIHTAPQSILAFLFRDEDECLLNYIYDEGDKIEPVSYLPIIPTILVNGCLGIATGHNTFVPNHNPTQIIDWCIQRLKDVPADQITEVNPWYFGYKGTIKLIDRRNKKKKNGKIKITIIKKEGDEIKTTTKEVNDVYNDDIINFNTERTERTESEEDDISESELIKGDEILNDILNSIAPPEDRPLLTMISYGDYYVDNGKIIITELPIGVWSKNYEDELDKLITAKKIKNKSSNCTKENVYIEIEGFQGPINHKTLKLSRAYGMSNMVLLDMDSKPVKYDTQYEILENFYDQRLPYYYQRKEKLLQKLKEDVSYASAKSRFIRAKLEKKIKIDNKNELEIRSNIINEGIEEKYIDNLLQIQIGSFSIEKIQKMEKEISKTNLKLEETINTTPEQMWMSDLEELKQEYIKYYDRELKNLQNKKPVENQVNIPKRNPKTRKRKTNK